MATPKKLNQHQLRDSLWIRNSPTLIANLDFKLGEFELHHVIWR
jgi:hypothetical protein